MRITRADVLWLIVLCALGILLGKLQTVARERGALDVFSHTVQAVVNPPARRINEAKANFHDFYLGFAHASALTAENRRLQDVAKAAQLYGVQERLMEGEIDQLRKLAHMSAEGEHKRIFADVWGYSPHESRLTISVGSAEGIVPGLAVASGEGLVGLVQTVDKHTSQVNLYSSPTFNVGAMAMRDPPQLGILKAESSSMLVLDYLDIKSPVEVGDLVVTSGLSEKVPRGIPIGKIVSVDAQADFGSRKAKVFPDAKLGALREVVVFR